MAKDANQLSISVFKIKRNCYQVLADVSIFQKQGVHVWCFTEELSALVLWQNSMGIFM